MFARHVVPIVLRCASSTVAVRRQPGRTAHLWLPRIRELFLRRRLRAGHDLNGERYGEAVNSGGTDVASAGSISFSFSRLGRSLFVFWLSAVIIFVAAWMWRPHERGRPPLPLGPSQLAAEVLGEDPPPERTGFSKLIHDRLLDRDDSWTAMKLARKRLAEHPGEPLYDPIFQQGAKFQYPPSSLHLIELLGSLGATALSNAVLNTISVGFLLVFLAAVYLIARPALPEPRRALLDHALPALLAVCCYPLLKALEIGQIQTWLNAMFAVALLMYLRGRTVAAGLLVGLMATIKPQMGLFLVWGLIQKEYRFAAALTACAAVLGVISLGRYGLDVHLEYLDVLSMISRHGESYFANQSLNGLLLRAMHLGPNLAFTVDSFAPEHPLVRWATLASSLCFIGFAMYPRLRTQQSRDSSLARGVHFSLAALCFTVASPIAWEHHYGIVPALFAASFVCLVRVPHTESRRLWIALAVAWLLLATRISAVGALADTPINFLQSHFYFGAITLLVVLHLLTRDAARAATAATPKVVTQPGG